MESVKHVGKPVTSEGVYSLNNKHRSPNDKYMEIATSVANKYVAVDLGSGGVVEAEALAKLGFRKVYAVDQCAEVFHADSLHASVEVIISSADDFINKFDEDIDFVSARHLFQYLPKNTHEQFIRTIASKLRKGGLFYFSLLAANSAVFEQHGAELSEIITNSYTDTEVSKFTGRISCLGDITITQCITGVNGSIDKRGNLKYMGSYYDLVLRV